MPTAATIIAERLAAAGCRFAFGIPGGEVLTLIDALAAAGIRFVLAKHENAAGFMAEGTWHQTGAPGVLVATVGPGIANAANVIANAHQDRVPMIVLSGCVDAAEQQTYTHQVFDHQALLRPITKATLMAVDGAVDTVIDKALAIALDGQPGPVDVDLPVALAAAPQSEPVAAPRPRPGPSAPAPSPDLAMARNWLAEAERPLVIAGVDVLTQGAEQAVDRFVHATSAPLITTYKAKGVVREDDPLALGGAGLSPKADSHLLPLLRQADLVVLAGYDPIEMRTGWRNPFAANQRVVEFSAVPNTHYMHRAGISFVGHVGAGLDALLDGVNLRPAWPGGEPGRVRASLKDAFAPGPNWGPAAVFAAARRILPPGTVVATDSGAHRILLSQMWDCPAPRTLLQSTALCTMGCALPLAAGSALADDADRPAPRAVIVGDGCLEMVLGELATVRDLALPIIVIVLVDESLALIELKQRKSGLPNVGVDFPGTDFAAVAAALGGHGVRVDEEEQLETALADALTRGHFTVIACAIGRKAYDNRI